MNLALSFVALLILACLSAGQQGNGKPNRNTLQSLNSCVGQPVNLTSKLEAVDTCFDNRIQKIEQMVADDGSKKAAKRKANLTKRLRKKCLADCEWISSGLVPESPNGTSYTLSPANTDEFIQLLPQEARSIMKSGIETCFNTTSVTQLKEGKNVNIIKQLCWRNKKLLKCLQKSLKQACKGKRNSQESTSPSTASTTATAQASVSVTTSFLVPSSSSSPLELTTVNRASNQQNIDDKTKDENDKDDSDKNEDEKDDDEKDDDENDQEMTTIKTSTPSTSINTSERITR